MFAASAPDLSVMSFNLRYATALDGQPWRRRRPVVAALIESESPAVIGTQEGLLDQLEDLIDDLPDRYQWTGEGRAGGNDGEFTAVVYDSARLWPEEAENFWLSETPDVPGSRSWGSAHPRMATQVAFTDNRTGNRFSVLNTHLDHRSDEARLRSVELILGRIRSLGRPGIVTGDFNVGTRSEVYRRLTGDPEALLDAWASAQRRVGVPYGTFHGYRPLIENGPRIDWILTTPDIGVVSAGTNPFRSGAQFPSDHLPVQAVLRLPRTASAGG